MKIIQPAVLACIALLAFGCAEQGESDNLPNALASAPISAVLAEKAYLQKCSLCHGRDGKLGISKATDLSLSTMSLARREAIIRYGKGLMPPQKEVLDDATILGIAQYIEEFREDA